MSDITIPAEFIGDPEYDGAKETLTFYGTSAFRIAEILSEAREKRERTEREERLSELVRTNAKRFSHRDISASSLHAAFQNFADHALEIFEVQR